MIDQIICFIALILMLIFTLPLIVILGIHMLAEHYERKELEEFWKR